MKQSSSAGLRWGRPLVVLLAVGALGGCSVQPQDCTTVGGVTGVSFDLSEVVDPTAGGTVRICVDSVCSDREVVEGGDAATPFVDDSTLTPDEVVTVDVVVTDRDGATTYDGAGTADLQRWAPNGEGCEPVLYRASVRAAADGTLT